MLWQNLCNKKDGAYTPSLLLRVNRKPCSVLNDDLSRLYVAAKFKPPPESCRTTYALLSGVAAGKVYIAGMSPHRWWALTPPFHPYRGIPRRYISVALSLRSPSADVISYPCPEQHGLSSRICLRTSPPSYVLLVINLFKNHLQVDFHQHLCLFCL